MNKIIIILIICIGLLACSRENLTNEAQDYKVNNDTVIVADNSPVLRKLGTGFVTTRSYTFELSTSGVVEAIPNNYALIAAPFSGRITRSFVRLGQEIKAGDPVFEISSPSYYETGKAYYQTKEEMDLAYKNLTRQTDLLNKGVGVRKDMEEAEVNYQLKRRDFENALASLRVYQVEPSDLVLGQPLVVRTPIDGTIVENNIVIGQYIKEDSEPVATVAELSKVWVAGQVKEKDIRYITNLREAEIRLISFPEKSITGKIYHIKSIINEETRSVQVLIECDNHDRLMKPGMFVTAFFNHNISDALVIPSGAIFQADESSFVFRHLSGNKYLKRKIEILTGSRDSSIVSSGLLPGDEIIMSGGIYLLEER